MTLLNMSLMGGLMILAAALLRSAAGRYLPRRAFLWLWTAAVCRLLLPLELASPLSIYRLLTLPRQFSAASVPTAASPAPSTVVSGAAAALTAAAPAAADRQFLLWAAGAAVLAVYLSAAALFWRCRFRRAVPVCSPHISAWKQSVALRRPLEVRMLDGISSPLTYGILRPVILLPAPCDRYRPAELQCILTHEYVHIRRFDALRKLILLLTLCVHWFNPAVWLLVRLADRDLELLCDQEALLLLGAERRQDYARTLLAAAARRSDIPLCSFFGKTVIEERILMIVNKKTTTLFSLLAAALLLAGFTSALATTAPTAEVPRPVSSTAVAAPEDTEKPAIVQTIDAAADSAAPSLIWPAAACPTITSPFGKTILSTGAATDHITISGENAHGSDVCAAAAGTVTSAGWNNRAGNCIEIDHGNGLLTRYTHCAELLVSQGSTVTQGQVIATVGKSGMATGPCLGFYVAQDGKTVDPLAWFTDR